MNKFIFTVVDPEKDCDFLNSCGFDFSFISPFGSTHDSGFCDAVTGQQIIGKGDQFMFRVNTAEELQLRLRCQEAQISLFRMEPLNADMVER
jgi:hypothetical protein